MDPIPGDLERLAVQATKGFAEAIGAFAQLFFDEGTGRFGEQLQELREVFAEQAVEQLLQCVLGGVGTEETKLAIKYPPPGRSGRDQQELCAAQGFCAQGGGEGGRSGCRRRSWGGA